LLGEIKEKENKSNLETDMEVSWIPNDVISEKVGWEHFMSLVGDIDIKSDVYCAGNHSLVCEWE
jgi:hypothetical protein